MKTPLLQSKFYIPQTDFDSRRGTVLVSRPRLIERLNEGVGRKLTLISAQAGFGKTTLVSQWLRLVEWPVAWISLDEGDNDPSRFLRYFVAALQSISISPHFGQHVLGMLPSPQPPPLDALLTVLVNELAQFSDPLLLILDDYHLITAQPIHDILSFLLHYAPPTFHLLITTRLDPPLPLARLRGRRELTELRAADLRFTPDEVAQFFNQVGVLELTSEDIAALSTRTEGWAVALQLVSIYLQGRTNVSNFVHTITGSHRYILDYLVEEVLQQQSDASQTFLLQTAILDSLSAPLCDAVTGQNNGLTMLEHLQRNNLFIVSLDDEPRWYRYHHLFAGFLRVRLQAEQPDLQPTLHRQAAEWYQKHEYLAEAISHYLKAGELEAIADLIEEQDEYFLVRGENATLRGWIEALPKALVRTRPRLSITYAWALVAIGDVDALESGLQDVEHALATPQTTEEEYRGEVQAIRAFLAFWQHDYKQATELSQHALAQLPPQQGSLRALLAFNLANVYARMGQVDAAIDYYEQAVAASRQAGNLSVALYALGYLGEWQALSGELHDAAHTYQRALQLATMPDGTLIPVAALAHIGLGKLHYQWNQLDDAAHHLSKGRELSQQAGILRAALDSLMTNALVKHQGKPERTDDILQEVEELAYRWQQEEPIRQVQAIRARLAIAQGDLKAAARFLRQCSVSVNDEIPSAQRAIYPYLSLARLLIAQGSAKASGTHLPDAERLLTRLLTLTQTTNRTSQQIEILILHALLLDAQGKTSAAMAELQQALKLAEPEGYIRLFVDEGAPLQKLLEQTHRSDYIQRLLSAFPHHEQAPPVPTPAPAPPPLLEPLTKREQQVLRLMAADLQSPEIAAQLFIAVSTVRSHIKHIYAKLDAHSRYEAVMRAEELNLL